MDFPFQLYRDCPQWVPPLRNSAVLALNRHKHPFYQHSTADFFMVESGKEVLGRMAVLENRLYNNFRGSKTAFFGYLEVVEDTAVANCLFDAALSWAQARGLTQIIGPRSVNGGDDSVLVAGFEHYTSMITPYNPPYYGTFIEAAGFEKHMDLLSGYLLANHQLSGRWHEIAQKVQAKRGFWIKTFRSKAEIRNWIPHVLAVHHQAFSRTRTFYPPTTAEIQMVIDSAMSIIDPRLVKLVMKGEEIIGFILAYHNLSAGLQKSQGRLWPLGWYHILQDKRRTQWVNIHAVGLLPAYQGLGANALLYTELQKTINNSQFQHCDIVQVDEQNHKSIADMENLGVHWYKWHRLYGRVV